MLNPRLGALALMVGLVSGCFGPTPPEPSRQSMNDVFARENRFPSYPQPNRTYLSFGPGHGYQVNYLGPDGKAWLWYPGNRRGVPEEYKRDMQNGEPVLCWLHPSSSYNPVTRESGGAFQCQSLDLSQRMVVASVKGDPFSLKSGRVPYPLDRCAAPDLFKFDREAFGC